MELILLLWLAWLSYSLICIHLVVIFWFINFKFNAVKMLLNSVDIAMKPNSCCH